MLAYYNEFDKKKCAALSQLMKDGYISKGEIDDRSIRDVRGDDLKGFERCHFFAGIGLWDYGLQLAGWPEDRPVWTGSCPCQPYSTAGKQKGKKDDRHLLPEWDRLIEECRPATIFGEQVANAITHGWLDDVYQRLEAKDYAIGSAVLPACSVGAPHRRERLWFVAHSNSINRGAVNGQKQQERDTFGECFSNGGTGSMVNSYDSNDRRNSREYEGEDGKVWLQERNKDWLSREPSEVSSTMADTENRDRGSWESPCIQRRVQLGKQIDLSMIAQGTGRMVDGLTVQTESKGSLNPEFPCWLMGIPSEWVSSIVQGMQSYRKLPRNL
jgi:DNA (cytosine-5)-methyltransferase 1